VSNGATATVRHNFVAKNNGGGGTGMFFFGAGQVVSEHNTVTSNDYGVYSYVTAAGTSVKDNRVRSGTLDGVVLASNGHQVTHNASEHNALTGVFFWNSAQNNSLAKNRISENNDSGILLDDANNNPISDNHVHNNGNNDGPDPDMTDGIRINAGAGNIIDDNHLKRNVTHDCHDQTLTANVWTDNKAGSSFPEYICGDDDADELEPITNFGWDANYPWYTSFSEAADIDFVAGYATLDLDSILALLPTIKIGLVERPKPIPCKP
jgi:parallel beta-helix repeat protein